MITLAVDAADTARRIALLQSDLRYFRVLLTGVGALLLLLFTSGLYVYLLLRLLPRPSQRPLRVGLGLIAAFIQATLGTYIFDPAITRCGAVGVGTLLAFHTPLRVLHLLSDSHPSSTEVSQARRLPPLRWIIALVAFPANPIHQHPPRDHNLETSRSPASPAEAAHEQRSEPSEARTAPIRSPAATPLTAIFAALGAFAFLSFAAYITPDSVAHSSLWLAAILLAATYGFANISAGTAAIIGQFSISSPFFWPAFAPSLGSFWARRWNAPMAAALRSGVYDPLIGQLSAPRAVATLACFVASGVGHVAILDFINNQKGMPLWFSFFFLHGVAVCIEHVIVDRKLLKSRLLRHALTFLFLIITIERLFIPVFLDANFFYPAKHEAATTWRLLENIVTLTLRFAVAHPS